MVGVFAAATARLMPEFVESFDPEKLAAKFVRVEKEFGVKFTKSKSTFNIVGHWEAVRKAHKSLLKLNFNEKLDEISTGRNEETFALRDSPANGMTETTDSLNNDEEVAHTPEREPTPDKEPPLLRGKGNPKRGRITTKESPYSAVPEPVFFLQYQDKTFTDAGSLDIDTVLEDFEKSQLDKKVTKEQLKKILEKNKDQMGKPLEKGIPKGAILPVSKVEQSCDTFVVEDMLNPIPPSVPFSTIVSSGIFGMPVIATDPAVGNTYSYMGTVHATLNSSTGNSSVEMSNPFDSQMITTYSVNAKMSTQSTGMVACNNQVNGQSSVAVEHINISDFYNHPDIHNGRLEEAMFADNQCNNTEQLQLSESDTDSFSSMFENYDPQAMLNQIPPSGVSTNISQVSATGLNQIETKPLNKDTGLEGQSVPEDAKGNKGRISNNTEEMRSDFPSSQLASGRSQCDINGIKMEMNGFEERDTSTIHDYTKVPPNPAEFSGKGFSQAVLPSSENSSVIGFNTNIDIVSMATSAAHNTICTPYSVSSNVFPTKNTAMVPNTATSDTNPNVFLKSMPTGEELIESTQVTMATVAQTPSYSSDIQSVGPDTRSDAFQDSVAVSDIAAGSLRLPDSIIAQVKDIAIATNCQEQSNTQVETNVLEEVAGNETRAFGKDEKDTKVEKAFVGLVSELHGRNVYEDFASTQNVSSDRSGIKKATRKTKTKKKQEKPPKVSPLKIQKSRLPGNKVEEKVQEKGKKVKQKRGRKPKSSHVGNKQKNGSIQSKETTNRDSTTTNEISVAESSLKHMEYKKPEHEQSMLNSEESVNSSNKEKGKRGVKQKDDKQTGEVKEKQIFKCTECDYQGLRKKRLSEHMGRVHGLLVNGRTPENPMFSCDECDKTFVFEKDLSRHKKIVHHGQIFVCLVCNKKYKSKYVYDRHSATHAEGYVQPKFKCQICEQEFTTKFSLSSHIKSKHLGVKKTYSCPTCGKTFSQIRSYRQHANVHAGIRPYTCEICGKSFTYDKSLKEHRYMHDTVRRFQCTICQKAFRQQTCLLIHMKTHKEKKDHICSVCGREFTQKQSLLRHERIHTGAKPYSCKICFKSFGDYAVIRKHIMMAHKSGKDSWKEYALTEESKRSSHYIDGGPGYVPRESYAKINRKNQETVMPPIASVGQVNVPQSTIQISNSQSLSLGEVLEIESRKRQLGNDISAPAQNNMVAIQDMYQVPSYSDTLDYNVMEPLKIKQDNPISHVDRGMVHGMGPIGTDAFDDVCSQHHNLNIKSYLSSLAENPSGKVPDSSSDAYTLQFLNSPDIAPNVAIDKSSVSITVKDELLSCSTSGVSVAISDSIVAGSLATMATTNNTYVYPGYSSAYFSPSSFSNYQSSPDT